MRKVTLTSPLRNSTLIFSLAISILVAACGAKDKDNGEASLQKAKEYLAQKNQLAAATIEIKNALQKNPDLAEARYLLGKSYLDQGDAKAAEFELRRAFTQKFDPDKVVPALVKSLLAQSEPEKVLLEFEGYKLQSKAAQAELLHGLGLAYMGAKKPEKAIEAFQEAQSIIPDYAPAVLGEAMVIASNGDYKGSLDKVNSVLVKSPANIEALMLKGDLYRSQNQLEPAIAAYQEIVTQNPNHFGAHFNLLTTYVSVANFEAAGKQVETLKKLSPKHPSVNYFEALIAYHDKHFDKASEAIQQTLAADPNYWQGLLLAGLIEMANNQPAQSETHLKLALSKTPGHLFTRKTLARLYLQQKEPLKAEEVLRPALDKWPEDAELLNLSGDIAVAKSDLTLASDFYAKATKANPKSTYAITQNALLKLGKGDDEHAIASLEAASKSDPNNSRADLALVLTHLKNKQYDKAFQAWRTLETRQPNSPLIYNLQAAILLGKKDPVNARKALDRALSIDPTYFPAAANLANLDIQDGKIDAAKQRYRSLIEKNKNHLHALLALASLEESTGASKSTVLDLLNQAVQANPNRTQPVLALANYQVQIGDNKQALAAIKNALIANPKDLQLLDTAGMLHLRLGEADQASTIFSELVKNNPSEPVFLLHLSTAQVSAGKVEAAHQSIAKALKLNPDSLNLQQNAVGLFLQAGKPDDALIVLNEIRKQSPKSPLLTELEANILLSKGDYAGAAGIYKKIFTASPRIEAMTKLHQALILAGNRSEADTLLNNWIKNHPDDGVAQLYSANLSLVEKNYAKADEQLRSLLKREPNNVVVLNNLAWTGFQLKDPKAIEYAEKAYTLAPNSNAVIDTLGWILVEQGQIKRGVELLQKAVGLAPQSWDIRLHLAKALIKDGRKDAAREHLQAIVKAAANSPSGKESAQLLTGL